MHNDDSGDTEVDIFIITTARFRKDETRNGRRVVDWAKWKSKS